MVDYALLSFAFSAGLVAFFSPCAVVLLPGYLTYFLSKYSKDYQLHKVDFNLFLKGLEFALLTILGFFSVFGLIGTLVIIIGQTIKMFIPWIAIITGFILVIVGILILFGKNLTINLPHIKTQTNKEKKEAYLFGIAYGVAALGCTFPLFLSIVIGSSITSSLMQSIYSLVVYIIGISVLMITAILLLTLSKKIVADKLQKLVPIITKISGVILIIAGLYMVYYQYVLLR